MSKSVRIPRLWETIDNDRAIELCEHYGLTEVKKEIENNRNSFKPWEFDGASMVPDRIVKHFGIPNITEIALQHDLRYAYGKIESEEKERKIADEIFKKEIQKDVTPQFGPGVAKVIADTMYEAIRAGGGSNTKMPWSWGFARI